MKRPIITLITDFGTADYYVGAMKGVILSICPEAQVIDITHEIAPWQVRHGAWMLAQTWECFPLRTIHVAVVDPGVGSERRPILLETAGHLFVAPDNGILTRVSESSDPVSVREITASHYFRQPVSRTFHGRDIFAPVAAHLANGLAPEHLGPLVDGFVRMAPVTPTRLAENTWRGEILWVDCFGNLVTSFDADSFQWVATSPFNLELRGNIVTRYGQYYGAMARDEPYLIAGSAGLLEVSLNQQDASRRLAAGRGETVTLRRSPRVSPAISPGTSTAVDAEQVFSGGNPGECC